MKVFKPVPCCYRFGIDVSGAVDKKGMDWRKKVGILDSLSQTNKIEAMLGEPI